MALLPEHIDAGELVEVISAPLINRLTLFDAKFGVAISGLLSPLKSATVSEKGLPPTA